jgi:hypothetical protein
MVVTAKKLSCCSAKRVAMKKASFEKAKKAADEASKGGGKHIHMKAKKATAKKATSKPAKPCTVCGKGK